jgi:Tfp pilus assembly protein PilF
MSAHLSTARSRPRNSKRSQRRHEASPERTPRARSGAQNLWICAALLFVTFVAYAQVRHFDFVNYDDPEYVTGNAHVRQGLTVQNLLWAASSREAANWFPITRVSHMLDAQLFGLDAGLHHLTNLLFHAFATLLVFGFLERATHARWPSAFAAALFALHPLHVESVAWIAERKDVLSAFCWFLALWAYVRYAQRPRWTGYLLVLLAFCAGLLSKPMVVTLPLVLLLLDFWPLRRLPATRRRIDRILFEKAPFFALSAAVAIVTYFAQQGSRAVKPFPIELRLENALVSYVTYIVKFFWPAHLAVFYPYPRTVSRWEAFAAFILLASATALVIRTIPTRPYLFVGWLWYLITLIPVIGIIQVGAQARADRYTYIPMVGLSIMLAWSLADALKRRPQLKPVFVTFAACACGCCAFLTFTQLQYWKNSESLFRHALEVTQDNYVAHHNYGLAIADQPGRLPEAISHYQAALQIQPESIEARTDLGTALAESGHFEEAIAEFQRALQLAPDCTICRNNLSQARTQWAAKLFQDGVSFAKRGRNVEAVQRFRAALNLQPDYAEAHNDLGVALGALGRTNEAIQQFKEAIRLNPGYEDARYNLAAARSTNFSTNNR